jgi:hypothetical protein
VLTHQGARMAAIMKGGAFVKRVGV